MIASYDDDDDDDDNQRPIPHVMDSNMDRHVPLKARASPENANASMGTCTWAARSASVICDGVCAGAQSPPTDTPLGRPFKNEPMSFATRVVMHRIRV